MQKIIYVPAKGPEQALATARHETSASSPWVFDEQDRAERQARFLTTSQQAWKVFTVQVTIEILED